MLDRFLRPALLAAAMLAVLGVGPSEAQDIERISSRLIAEVMPEADRFDPADGDPPVKRAYRGDELIGYVFVTSDLPPEEVGYSGSIQALVGMTTEGVLTGVRATRYRESLRFERGDFLSEPSFLAQFVGKAVTDRFGLRQDIDGISGVTISVRAMSRGLRDAARRVALAYFEPPAGTPDALSDSDLLGMSWYEMRRRGVAVSMLVRQERRDPFEVSIVHPGSDELTRYLVGDRYESLVEKIEEAGGADETLLYVVGGDGFVSTLRTGWAVEQGGRTVEIPRERVVTVGRPGGALIGESSQVGALLLDPAEVDVTVPLTVAFDRGRPELGTFRVDYTSRAAFVRMAEAARAAEAERVASAAEEAPVAATAPAAAPPPVATSPPVSATPPAATSSQPVELVPRLPEPAGPEEAATEAVEATDEDAAVSNVAWLRLGWTTLVIVLACLAFFTRQPALRWVSLAATTVILGWIDGGFLSISHVTGLIWVGLSAVRSDLPLLIMVSFTLATLLLWGRLFCGYLCPFGALQDFIDRLVPRRFKRHLSPGAHRMAWKAKYLVLAIILGAAAAGLQVSLYQYFEPFGTVFFFSRSALLWAIAGSFLLAAAVIPRFYCRYVCPLGALLAIGSLASLRRIGRVEQCDHCHVCEQRCPTGAITGPSIAFTECVRCSVCEVQLIERKGVCRHDMEEIRPRLVQLRRRRTASSGGRVEA